MSDSRQRLEAETDPKLRYTQHDLADVVVAADLNGLAVSELALRARDGCATAFAELDSRFRPRLLKFLEKRLANAAFAEDVTQDALSKAWLAIGSFDSRYQFTTWLYTIAVRTAAGHLRRYSRTVINDSLLVEQQSTAAKSVESMIERAELAENIWSIAERSLNKDQYSALWLRYGEDLSINEVATILKRTTVGVRVLLHRGRTKLQPHLLEYDQAKIARGGTDADTKRHSHEGDE